MRGREKAEGLSTVGEAQEKQRRWVRRVLGEVEALRGRRPAGNS